MNNDNEAVLVLASRVTIDDSMLADAELPVLPAEKKAETGLFSVKVNDIGFYAVEVHREILG